MTLPDIVKPIAGRVAEVFRSNSLMGVDLRVALPNQVLKMYKPRGVGQPDQVHFRVPLKLNKLQVRHHLESLYGVKVNSVNTVIYNGKWKREAPRARHKWLFKQRKLGDYKKAIVTIDEPFYVPKG